MGSVDSQGTSALWPETRICKKADGPRRVDVDGLTEPPATIRRSHFADSRALDSILEVFAHY